MRKVSRRLMPFLILCYLVAYIDRTNIGFAALTHDLGKALTPAEELPKHILHEQRGLEPLEALCARLKVPGRFPSQFKRAVAA